MPYRRWHTEAALEALQPLRGQRDLRQQHQCLPALPQALRHGLQIGLGLARPGHPVEQRHAERACRHRRAQRCGCGGLIRREDLARMLRVRDRERRHDRQRGGHQQSRIGQAAHHADAHPGGARQVGRAARLLLRQRVQYPAPCRGDPQRGQGIGAPPAGSRPGRARREHAQRHRHHFARRRQRVARHPVDKLAQCRPHRRGVHHARHRLQLAVRHACVGGRVPDDAHLLAPVQRHQHHIAGRRREAGRNPVVERTGKRIGQQHRNALDVT